MKIKSVAVLGADGHAGEGGVAQGVGEKGHPAWRYRVRGTVEASEKQRMQN